MRLRQVLVVALLLGLCVLLQRWACSGERHEADHAQPKTDGLSASTPTAPAAVESPQELSNRAAATFPTSPAPQDPQTVQYFCRIVDLSSRTVPEVDVQIVDGSGKISSRARSDRDGLIQVPVERVYLGHRSMAHFRAESAQWTTRLWWSEPGHDAAEHAQVVEIEPLSTLLIELRTPSGDPVPGHIVRCVVEAGDLLSDLRLPGFTRVAIPNGSTPDSLTGEPRAIVGGLKPQEWSGQSDSHGNALLRGVPSEIPLQILVETASAQLAARSVIALARGTPSEAIRITVPPFGSVCGPGVAGKDMPVAERDWVAVLARTSAPHTVLSNSGPVQAHTRSNLAGEFRLDGLPAGDYFVAPRLRSNDPWKGSYLSSVGTRVTVRAGETSDLGLIVWDVHARIHGQVLSAQGDSIAAARVFLRVADGQDSWSVASDPQGRFEFGPVPAGSFQVQAMFAQGSSSLNCESDGRSPTSVTLVLEERGQLHFRSSADSVDTTPILACVRVASPQTDQQWVYRGADSSCTLGGIPAISVEVWAEWGDGRVARQEVLPIQAGSTTEVVLVPEEPASLELEHVGTQGVIAFEVRSAAGSCMIRDTLGPRQRRAWNLPEGGILVSVAGATRGQELLTLRRGTPARLSIGR